jgi:hypothetical protein
MAYSQYSQPQQPQPQAPMRQPLPSMGGMQPTGGASHPWMQPAQQTQQPQAPPGALPTNTRQQALGDVQQAYAQPTRMPGDMGFLNSLLSQSSQPASANDPILAPAMAAGRVADQRNIDRQRSALAEQLGGAGLGSSGGMNTRLGGIQQQVGEQAALRESGMVMDESNARRNALLQALGLDQGRYQGDNSLGVRLAELEAQMNRDALGAFL